MAVTAALSSGAPIGQTPLRVMVVDDSVVIRGMISRWLEAEADIAVVASLRTGRDAVNQIVQVDPDVVVLDIEMPDLDGLSALPLLMEKKRNLVVIMASTLTRRNAEVSLKALSLGAADYIPKPESTREAGAAEHFRRDLVEKIRQLGSRRRKVFPAPTRAVAAGRPVVSSPIARPGAAIKLRPWSTTSVPRVLVIGSSTGGPQALMDMLTDLGPSITNYPVLITQHMPPTFTTILAEHLARCTRKVALEAVDGEIIQPGRIYVAPGGKHMRVARQGRGDATIVLGDDAPINFCKPAVDPLFTSAANAWPGGVLGVVLTGMGADGAKGGADIVASGGNIIAQDEATSVVWGMPGAAANAGICAAVLPLKEIAPRLKRCFLGERM